jgi:hypothetical protein
VGVSEMNANIAPILLFTFDVRRRGM